MMLEVKTMRGNAKHATGHLRYDVSFEIPAFAIPQYGSIRKWTLTEHHAACQDLRWPKCATWPWPEDLWPEDLRGDGG